MERIACVTWLYILWDVQWPRFIASPLIRFPRWLPQLVVQFEERHEGIGRVVDVSARGREGGPNS